MYLQHLTLSSHANRTGATHGADVCPATNGVPCRPSRVKPFDADCYGATDGSFTVRRVAFSHVREDWM
jgi:hypothetical protein